MEVFTVVIRPWANSVSKIEVDSTRPLTEQEVAQLPEALRRAHNISRSNEYPPPLELLRTRVLWDRPELAAAIVELRDYYQRMRDDGKLVKTTFRPFAKEGVLVEMESVGALTDQELQTIAGAVRVAFGWCFHGEPPPALFEVKQAMRSPELAERIVTYGYR